MKPNLNQNNTLITVLSKSIGGYGLYETSTYKKVSEDDDYQTLFGQLRFFIPLYESQICFFVGTASNNNFPPNQIIIWDESRKRKIGIIVLKGDCDDLKVRKEFLICLVDYKILIYDIFTMNLVSIIDDCNASLPISLSNNSFPAVFAYQCRLNTSQIKVCKIDMEKINGKTIENFIKTRYPTSFLTDFADIYKIKGKAQYVITTLFSNLYNFEVNNKVS